MNFSIDASIARYVFRRNVIWIEAVPLMAVAGDFVSIPKYSTDRTQARLAAEKMQQRGYPFIFIKREDLFLASFDQGFTLDKIGGMIAFHKDEARAICMGALSAIGFGQGEGSEE